jgi:stress-induced morphogen
MGMQAAEIEALIKAALPDAEVTIEDLAGDGDHYAAKVVSSAFKGLPCATRPHGGCSSRAGLANLCPGIGAKR